MKVLLPSFLTSGVSPAVRAFSLASLMASRRGVSRLSGVSSISAGIRRSGLKPACSSSAKRRGEALASTSLTRASVMPPPVLLFEAVVDTALGQVIGRHFDHHAVAGQDPDAILAHLSGSMGDDFMIVVELYAKRGIGQELGDRALEFKQFFLRHWVPWLVCGGATHEPVAEQNQACDASIRQASLL